MNNNLLVIIPCAGIGNRFSSQIEKQHASLGALSVIETTLSTFMKFDDASKIVVVVKDPERFQEKISIKPDEDSLLWWEILDQNLATELEVKILKDMTM